MRCLPLIIALLSTSGFGEKLRYEGQSLNVLAFRDNHSMAVQSKLERFKDLTGATVRLDMVASSTVATKTATDQLAGGSYDIYAVDEPFVPQLSVFFIPFDQWPAPTVVDPSEITSENFLRAAAEGATFRGKQYGLPISSNVYMYVYRSDLFSDPQEKENFKARYGYDLAPPKTTQEFKNVAEFFTRPPKMYGFAPFTKKSEGTTVEAMWILSTFGVRFFDNDLNVVFDAKAAAKAFSFYVNLMEYAPKGGRSWHHSERMAAYSKGKVVQILTWPSFVKGLEDPTRSLVVGKNSYALPPKGPGGESSPVAGTWSLAIAKTSKKPQLAAEFAAFWASSRFGKILVPNGMNPARKDLLRDQELVRDNPWFAGIDKSFTKAVVRPRFPKYKQVSDKISYHFTKMITGESSPKEAAEALESDLRRLVKKLKLRMASRKKI